MAAEKSRILVVGGTGCLGRHVVAASARLGHPTLALVRDTVPSDPAKAQLLKSFQAAGITLLKGDLDDHGSLVSAVRLADVVISTVGVRQIPDQTKLVAAIKEAGNVKRFLPSEFGLDADRSEAVEPTRSLITATKAAIRRAVEAAGVPYTYVLAGYFFCYGLPGVGQVLDRAPPRRQGRRPRRRRRQGGVRGRGGHRGLRGARRRRPARREQDAAHQAAGQHAVAQRAAGAVGAEDRQGARARARPRGRRPQADPRGFDSAEPRAVDRARDAHQGGAEQAGGRPGVRGGRRRALPGREVHHRR
ncbi:hypothetical protein PVAP13_5KG148800 [Panicum virgatum]|uniref:NmrA-like domain-containing protein n=1 Tax=Panicum virgatum TaxID=38727 RepID=A0A8T0SAN9_PANVG|nr:hypothetical protein PVAP13_5KG148800 [Panicum virgatum]